ncbi:MAG: GMP synthase subunit A [Methanobacterium sp.]|jgi:GMP synthase (glutamine-hydrolysing)|nr:GMP synthase subunit A [Methanobacterium sp.]
MILVVNNHGQYNHRINRALHYLKIPSELVPNNIPLNEIEDKEPVGLIIGGGPSVKRSGMSSQYIKKLDYPVLGICLGHQILAQTYGGQIDPASSESFAQIQINILDENDIFKGLGTQLDVWASHKDEITKLPPDFKILATSTICDVEAIKHKNKPLYGIQFHPEVHHTPNGPKVFDNFYKVCLEHSNRP